MLCPCSFLFFYTHPSPTEIYPLSLHDALPIWVTSAELVRLLRLDPALTLMPAEDQPVAVTLVDRLVFRGHQGQGRSEEHTSELQSHHDLVCRLLLEKKKNTQTTRKYYQHTTNN